MTALCLGHYMNAATLDNPTPFAARQSASYLIGDGLEQVAHHREDGDCRYQSGEYRTKIKTYVTGKKIRPVATQERIVVGAKVPASVELKAVPADWGLQVSLRLRQ